MARESVPRAAEYVDPHVFAPNLNGLRDHRGRLIECLACPYPPNNGVHVSSAEVAAGLPPTPEDDRSDEMIGERP